MNNQIAFICQDEELLPFACEITRIISDLQVLSMPAIVPYVYLLLKLDGLWLYTPSFEPFHLDKFYAEFIAKRRKIIGKELLIKAANPKVVDKKLIALDLTAGIGRDSILLLLAGYRVTMLENNPYLAIILNYLRLAFSSVLADLTVLYTNNHDFLISSSDNYDLVYYDPMFEDGKMALAKKEMQIIDFLIEVSAIGVGSDNNEMWQLLKSHCSGKVIVKRDNKQKELFGSIKPTYAIKGKTVRFDVYQC